MYQKMVVFSKRRM